MKLTVTSKLNITLHFIAVIGFAGFAWISGNSFFGGVCASLALIILVDTFGCLHERIKQKEGS